ncbi:MAG: DUF4367 domain-containing protein [Lachnospiraceae bacterium]
MKVLNSYGITKKENGVENVRNSKVSQEEDKLIQQKLQEAFGYTDEQLAAQLDQAAAEYAAHPELNLTPPKGEFEKILAMAAQDETQDKEEDVHKVIRLKKVMKPMILVATVGAILLGTGMMASGRRYYKFWERDAGNGQIIFNNVDALSDAGSLDMAYEKVETQMGMKIPRMYYIPEDLDYKEMIIDDGLVRMDFKYKNRDVYFYQVTKENANSTGFNSDREAYKIVYNRYLNQDINIYKSELEDGNVELGAYYVEGNTFYYFVGRIDEDVFDKIIKNLSYSDFKGYRK